MKIKKMKDDLRIGKFRITTAKKIICWCYHCIDSIWSDSCYYEFCDTIYRI